jgi:hypothetical protein
MKKTGGKIGIGKNRENREEENKRNRKGNEE